MSDALWNRVQSPCFVSHSYRDSDVVERLRQLAPEGVELKLFSRVEPDPSKAVSDSVIPEIRNGKSLIYLEGGASASSFWVSFERDYAHRANLDVFAFDPINEALSVDDSAPIDLSINTLSHPDDKERVDALFEWMRNSRNFDIKLNHATGRLGGVRADDAEALKNILLEGGAMLWLAGPNTASVIDGFRAPAIGKDNGRSLPSRVAARRLGPSNDGLDDVEPLNEYNEEFYYMTDPYRFASEVFVKIDPSLSAAWQPMGGRIIDVFAGAKDGDAFNWNRVDDLIIRLYAALTEQHRVTAASPPQTRAILEDHIPNLIDHWQRNADSFGRVRLGTGSRPRADWTLSTRRALQVLDRASTHLSNRFGRPTAVSRVDYPTYPFDDDCPAHHVAVWVLGDTLIELSIEFDDPLANVYLRRLPRPEDE